MSTQAQVTGFLGALFDFSFSSFISARLIRVLYALGLILAGLTAFALLGTGLAQGLLAGLFMLMFAPLGFLLFAMYLRVLLELVMVMFRIAENVERIANRPSEPASGGADRA